MLGLLLFSIMTFAQKMTWTSTSDAAREKALRGAHHFINVEFPQAYQDFSEAITLDPDFTVALVFMSNLTRGEVRKAYAERALKSAANKTEGEKMFASLVDPESTPASGAETMARLHKMFPNGAVIDWFYVQSRPTSEERIDAAEEAVNKFPNEPAMFNMMGYIAMQDKKDNDKAKTYFEKYISMYPEGYNPYDSMGEFYLNVGDTTNSKKYYMLSLEKYPFNNSSINALQKINGTGR
jgi:tetratricopeptide (TPR) repeat protein